MNQDGLDDYVHLLWPGDPRYPNWNDMWDVPTFGNIPINGVVEVLPPALSIRLSQVELCWQSCTNNSYQLQSRADVSGGVWQDEGTPMPGSGQIVCAKSDIVVGQPQRIYRISILSKE